MRAGGPQETPEVVLHVFDGLYAWPSPRPGWTLFGAHVGRVLLTTKRFHFLSTGSSGVGKELLYATAGGPAARLALGQTSTEDLDLGAIRHEGSLSLPLRCITGSRVARRWDSTNYLVVEAEGAGGYSRTYSFATRFGQDRRELLELREALEGARARAADAVAAGPPPAGFEGASVTRARGSVPAWFTAFIVLALIYRGYDAYRRDRLRDERVREVASAIQERGTRFTALGIPDGATAIGEAVVTQGVGYDIARVDITQDFERDGRFIDSEGWYRHELEEKGWRDSGEQWQTAFCQGAWKASIARTEAGGKLEIHEGRHQFRLSLMWSDYPSECPRTP